MARKKQTLTGDLEIPKPTKKTYSPDLDFAQNLQTDFATLNPLEKVQLNKIKNLKDDNIELEKIKK